MISVLILEDDAAKRANVAATIRNAAPDARIELAVDVLSARVILETSHFDLLVLDLSVPPRMDLPARPDGGVQLLDEIQGPRGLRRPTYIVGLTGFPDLLAGAYGRFSQQLIALLPYSSDSDEWSDRLTTLVTHIKFAKEDAERGDSTPRFGAFMVIVCALDSPELRSVRQIPWGWTQHSVPRDDTVYWLGKVPDSGAGMTVVAAAARHMGVAASAVLAAKAIEVFRPKYLAMTGIAAATSATANYGDVLVADPCWEWASGKLLGGPSGSAFLAAPRQLHLAATVRNKMSLLAEAHGLLEEIRTSFQGNTPDRPLAVRIGPLATGPAVVADSIIVDQVRNQHRKVIGVDMEAYAVFSAAEEAREPRPIPLVLKSVVDYADESKSDSYHVYGAYTSSRVLQAFVERYLVPAERDMK